MSLTMLIALIALNVCHWAADFTHLSTDWMLNAKRYGKPLYPIFIHALVHALLFFTTVWILYDLDKAIFAGGFQLITHFMIDLIKGKISFWFKKLEDPSNKYHWWVFGADQFMHHLVIILTVYFIS
ncbi:MAG: DUF3307 domain-containing protein [Bacteroidia bacterium]|nr:DUF3307 domain-containing protein [Sphingobacteriaceae bacterium]MBK7311165.1 DUF3307 domain-containing protein [Sphingobacteriaceae bacterium]MBK7818345.1 DUF3307 domain-containing protein [Sphingobacteriaceae bacterium]MBP9069006.1 DUF3307 domain-containing protein [Bacteroidia bacterium]